LDLIKSVVEKHIDDPKTRELVLKSESEGYKVGKYIVEQIPYTDLDHIDFPPLPRDENGDLDPLGETPRVQRYGPLEDHWIGDPFASGDTDQVRKDKYEGIPVGFPVEFGQKRYTPEGFSQWRFHNGVKAIRFTYNIFPGRPFEKEAHVTLFFSGGDH